MPSASDASYPSTSDMWVVEPRRYGLLDRLRELWRYRYLWWYFAGTTLTSQYRRSALGWFWMLMRVAGPIGLSSVVFGGVLKVPSGNTPYFLFFLCGIATWMLFERSLIFVTRSLEQNRRIITKVYFPRLILPVAAVSPALLYLAILLVVMIAATLYYFRRDGVWYITLQPGLLMSAGAIVVSLVFAIAVGLWTSVLQARYRDIRYGLRYTLPFGLYFTPIIYPLSHIPEQWRWVAMINPMAPIVEAFKWGTLGEGTFTPVSLAMSLSLVALTLISGLWFFTREEAASVDKL
jgi:lipopolysaccharide transport system permease protein